MIDYQDVAKFEALFRGNERSYGVYLPLGKSKMMTVKSNYKSENARSHLEGEQGLGVVPIMDDDKCWFAAIDIDVHGPNSQKVDLLNIEGNVTRNRMPLVVCRSKSGGAHCYLFLKEPTEASRVRMVLTRWATALGFPSAEIFPKQATLTPQSTDTEKPLGNWINLPYFNANETDRFAVDGGKQVTLEYFLELAEGRRADITDFDKDAGLDYVNGPPCLQAMMENKIDEGSRNTAVFQAGVFLKRAFPVEWRAKLGIFNSTALMAPLGASELRQISGSVAKKDYQYKCREEPCKSLCNKEMCRKRDFGITDNDATANEIPLIDKVEKVIATPIRWALTIKTQTIEITTGELFNYEAVRQAVGEKLHVVLPRIKAHEWDQYLREIMTKVTVREEMTIDDVIYQKLCDYLRRVHTDKARTEAERRNDIRRGTPALIGITRTTFEAGTVKSTGEVEWYYAFKLSDFVEYLRRKKALPCYDHQMATYLYRILGEDAKRDKLRVGNEPTISNVWCVPERLIDDEVIPTKEFKAEY